ncbi:MAG: hypothetical protein JNG89_02000 [Planctomycetaceae bacterium]|nr:hypothetical protein [Planctomycetaceae bacterium]
MWRTTVIVPSSPSKVRIGGSIAVGAPPIVAAPAREAGTRTTTSAPVPAAPPAQAVEPPPPTPAPPPVNPYEPQIIQLLESITRTLGELETRRRESLTELQQAVVELSVAMASQLTYRIIESGEFAVEKMVEDAVSRLPAAEHVTLRLHPDDLSLFHQRLKSIPAAALDARSLELTADPEVSRGGCLAELPEQGILCDIEMLLGDLHTELMEGLSDAQVERRHTQGANRSLRRFPDRRETA